MPPSCHNSPAIKTPFLIPLNLDLPSMALTPLTFGCFRLLPPGHHLLGPYKRESTPLEQAAPPTLAFELSLALLHSRVELAPPPFSAVIVPHLRHRSCFGEHLYGPALFSSPSLATTGELQRVRAPGQRRSNEPLLRARAWSTSRAPSPPNFPVGK
jgi:hypothetical protein